MNYLVYMKIHKKIYLNGIKNTEMKEKPSMKKQ